MVDTRQRLVAHAKAGEADLNRLVRARGRDEIARLMRRLRRWRRELIALAEAHDPVALHGFRIVRPEPHELVRIWRRYPEMRNRQRRLCNYVEAALYRLNEYLRRPNARPKRPGRKKGQKLYEDKVAIAAGFKLLASRNPPSRYKAAQEVVHLADKGQSPEADFARIYKALRGV